MSGLYVYFNSQIVGHLQQDKSGLLKFTYNESWLKNPAAIPLSRSLPLQSGAFPGKKARPFFAGILPEQGPRRRIAEILGISEANDYALLERIGGDCAGAISLLPVGHVQTDQGASVCRPLSESEWSRIVAELPRNPLLAGTGGLRMSLAGAQDKVPVILESQALCLPIEQMPSTHILKPEPDRFPGLASNEAFCLMLARVMGLDAAEAVFLMIGDKACVLVKRYDRRADEAGRIERLHQEDFCQALGHPPEKKYQEEGGPTLSDCLSLLQEWSTAPALDVPRFIRGLIFNVLIGNTDAHAKNHALLYSSGERRLAPLYDLVSTFVWPELSTRSAMRIGHSRSIDVFELSDWMDMAKSCGLGWPMIRIRVVESCAELLAKLDHVRRQARELDAGMVERLATLFRERAERLQKAFTSP
jgi:serine/threonine-protein kinase HipA